MVQTWTSVSMLLTMTHRQEAHCQEASFQEEGAGCYKTHDLWLKVVVTLLLFYEWITEKICGCHNLVSSTYLSKTF